MRLEGGNGRHDKRCIPCLTLIVTCSFLVTQTPKHHPNSSSHGPPDGQFRTPDFGLVYEQKDFRFVPKQLWQRLSGTSSYQPKLDTSGNHRPASSDALGARIQDSTTTKERAVGKIIARNEA